MPLTVLLQTSRASAEATVERLQALEIDAQVVDRPNLFVKLASGGNYRVRVAVPEEELGRARTEVERWEVEARPRVQGLAREVSLVLGGITLAAAVLAGLLLALGVSSGSLWGLAAWILGVAGWVVRSRGQVDPG